MAVILTASAFHMLCKQEPQTTDFNPVLQVTDILALRRQTPAICNSTGDEKDRYDIMLSDGKQCQLAMLHFDLNEVVRSQKLQKGSIVRLTGFLCTWSLDKDYYWSFNLIINNVDVINDKCDIIGQPTPMTYDGNFHVRDVGDADFYMNRYVDDHVRSLTKEHSCPFQSLSKQQKSNESNNIERNMRDDDDDVGACIEKLEKLGWEAQDPLLYDTALLLFCESEVYRKVWLRLLNPQSCGKWVRNVGSKHGLLG